MGKKITYSTFREMTSLTRIMTEEFIDFLEHIWNRSGLYFLYDDYDNLRYIGKSINLSSRILDSILARQGIRASVMLIDSKPDMHILEMYYIGLMKPKLNNESTHEKISFEINHQWEETEIIPIFTDIKEIEDVKKTYLEMIRPNSYKAKEMRRLRGDYL